MTGSASLPSSGFARRITESRWTIALVMAVAAALCLLRVDDWSMWQDEETSVYFSQHLEKSFPRASPLYFWLLNGVYRVTGVSVAAGRLLAAVFGLLCIWLTYVFLKRHVSRGAGLAAAVLLAACLDQLFWSQSIRYYTMVAAIQLGSLLLFFEGFEEDRLGKLVLSGALAALALLVNFTAVLLIPVLVGYLLAVVVLRQPPPGFRWRNVLAVLTPALVGLVLWLPEIWELRNNGALGAPPGVQLPFPILARILAYYGVPMVGLAAAAALLVRPISRAQLLVLCWALLPILELFTLGGLRLTNVSWNHAMVAMYGMAALAGIGLSGCWDSGRHRTATAAILLSMVYYASFAGLYYTTMAGNRPPWRRGAQFLQSAAHADPRANDNPPIYCTLPAVLAHYLGVPPGETDRQKLVQELPAEPPREPAQRSEWYVVTRRNVSPQLAAWLEQHCQLQAEFPARTGPIDHGVAVYVRPPAPRP